MKYYILIAIAVILIGLTIQQIYAESKTITCKEGTKTITECLIYGIYQTQLIIIEQNGFIIENQEWMKCTMNNENRLGNRVVICGEMP